MEFIYLVTQGESLQEKLKGQVARLSDYARQGVIKSGEIELLTLVSVASAYGAQLKVKPLIDSIKLAVPKRTFELFEKEYLLRLSPDGSLVRGLHQIRSEKLASLLTDPTIYPWSECARKCLPLIYETDIESFLLYAFLRPRKDTESLTEALNFWQPDRWVSLGGVTRALIWLGIKEYVERNKELIQDTFKDAGAGFWILLDSDISNAIPGLANSTLNSLCSLNPTEEFRQRIVSYRYRQTDKLQVFSRARTWLSIRTVNPVKPLCNEDWSGMAEVSFWLGRFGIRWPFHERIPYLELEKAIEYLPLEILADLVFGLNYGYEKDFAAWRTSNYSKIIDRFREETHTVYLQDEENKVTAHFLVDFEILTDTKLNYDDEKSSDYLHLEAMRRIWLLRRILPDRDTYACQGYGHRIENNEISIDNTNKVISVSSLPSRWLISVNSTFRGLAEKPYRPQTWDEYAKIIFEERKQTLDAEKQLENCLKVFFQQSKQDKSFSKLINVEQWNRYQYILSKSPLIPLCTIDEWGFVDEFNKSQSNESDKSQTESRVIYKSLALQKHTSLLTFLEKYSQHRQHLRNFFNQSIHAIKVNQIHGKCGGSELGKRNSEQKMIENGVKPNFIRLSEINLTEFITILPTFQRKFRETLGQFIEVFDPDDLERQEKTIFHNLWCMWYFFIYNPNLTSSNPKKEFVKKVDRMTNNIKKTIEENLTSFSSENTRISVCDSFWEDMPALWISIDGNYGLEVMISANRIFPEIFESINSFIETELAKLIFKTKWPLIILVTKIQGKCLTDIAWIANSYNFLLRTGEDKSNLWNFATPKKIPRDVLTELNIKVWDLPQLEVATRFVRNIEKLSLHLAVMKDLKKLTILDDQGIVQFKIYTKKLMECIKLETQIILTSAEEMKNFIEISSSSDYHIYPNMSELEKTLTEVIKYITSLSSSLDGIELELKTVVEWVDKLDEWKICVIYASNAYLFWVSYVINRSV